MKQIEIVVPCYNEEKCIRPLYEAIDDVFKEISEYSYSILYVNDGSKDNTQDVLQQLKKEKFDKINYISFARNFGKEAAIYAGLSNTTSDLVILMDCDLQHPPTIIPEMIKGIEEGYDSVGARRINRKGELPIRSLFSNLYYRIIKKTTGMETEKNGSDFRMMTRQVVDAIMKLDERERFTKGILSWVGFNTKWIEYENVERFSGKSKWSFFSLTKYAANGIISFATVPLKAVICLGGFTVLASIVFAIYTIISTITHNAPRTGYTTIVSLILFIGGIIIILLGVIGEYVARIYTESKHRPIYIEKENTKKSNGRL